MKLVRQKLTIVNVHSGTIEDTYCISGTPAEWMKQFEAIISSVNDGNCIVRRSNFEVIRTPDATVS